jgi:hypothetical protein
MRSKGLIFVFMGLFSAFLLTMVLAALYVKWCQANKMWNGDITPTVFLSFCLLLLAIVLIGWIASTALIRESGTIRGGTNVQVKIGDIVGSNSGAQVKAGDNLTITGSGLGEGVRINARDITSYSSQVDQSKEFSADLKILLKRARAEIEDAGLDAGQKVDVNDDLGKLTDELKKSPPVPDRVKTIFKRIADIAPKAATILSSATAIAKLLGG